MTATIRTIITFLLLPVLSLSCCAQERDTLLLMFWNMENFFDYRDGEEGEADKEFSSFGNRRWTKSRFLTKCNAIAKSIYWISDRYGRLPDLIGLAEIENGNVLYRLLNDTALKKAGYSFIHFDGRDRRGIDVAILYRREILTKETAGRRVPLLIHSAAKDTLLTRDILHARMKTAHISLDFVVNHHPSKFGGEKASEGRRTAVMACMRELCDSLLSHVPEKYGGLISTGDFNDTADSKAFALVDGLLHNKGKELHDRGLGTIRYEGRWELIDTFLVSEQLADKADMEIVRIPFLMVRDSKHTGEKPLRTYSGPKYIGGVSDHCPIVLKIYPSF